MKKRKTTSFIFILIILLVILLAFVYIISKKYKQINFKSKITTPALLIESTIPADQLANAIQKYRNQKAELNRLAILCLDSLVNSPLAIINANESRGAVEGQVFYPSGKFPKNALACAYSLDTKTRHCTSDWIVTEENRYYKLELPTGRYYIYLLDAYGGIGLGSPNKGKGDDYRTFSDQDGRPLGVAPLLIEINNNSIIKNIDIGDDIFSKGTNNLYLYCKELY